MRFKLRRYIVVVSCAVGIVLVALPLVNLKPAEAPSSDAVVDDTPIYDVSREDGSADASSGSEANGGVAANDDASSASSIVASQQSDDVSSSLRAYSSEVASAVDSASNASSRLNVDASGQNSSASASDSFDGKHLDENGVYKPDDKANDNAGFVDGGESNKGSEEDIKWGAIT